MDDLLTFNVVIDKVSSDKTSIGWNRQTIEVYAKSEEEAMQIISEEMPGYTIHSIELKKDGD